MFKSDKPECLPWDTINALVYDLKQTHEQKQKQKTMVFSHYETGSDCTKRESFVRPSPKTVSRPHFVVSYTAQSDDNLSCLDEDKYSYAESDASVDGSVPSLASSPERSPSPASSLDDLAQCNEEKPTPNNLLLLCEGEEKLRSDELLHCEEILPPFIEERWNLRHKELLEFMQLNGHVNVPHTYPKNQPLARWVKRQRRQYKLLQDGKPSAMTLERIEILNSCGFIWDFHELIWKEKIHELQEFIRKHGHCNVQTKYRENKKLGTWVKCQRRQYKLYRNGKPSAMDSHRVKELEGMGFEWEIRQRR